MLKKYREIQKGEFIVAGYDLAMGAGDYCAVQFISQGRVDVPFVYHSTKIASQATPEIAQILNEIYDATGVMPVIAPETNNGGAYECDKLNTLNKQGKYKIYKRKKVGVGQQEETETLGWTTSTSTRPIMLQDLKDAVDNATLKIYDEKTINEMFAFVVKQTSTGWKAQAETHAHDDLVMALAIAWQLYQSEKKEEGRGNYFVPNQVYTNQHKFDY